MGEDEERASFDDLFEDLDTFFAPERRKPRGSGRPEGSDEGKAAGSEEEGEGAAEGESPEAEGREGEAEILPSGWLPDVGELDLTGEEQAAPPTGEVTGEDWDRLHDVLGQPEEHEYEFPEAVEPEATEERPEITIDDLKKPPSEYQHLPGPGAAESPGGPEEGKGPGPEEGEGPGPEEPWVPPSGEEEPWEEPAISDVEAAADHLAGEYREEEPSEDLLADLERPSPPSVEVGQRESMVGPSWEEPGAFAPEPAPPRLARNLPAAFLTAIALIAAALVSLAIRKAAFAVVAGAVVLIGQAELYATTQRKGYQPATALGLVVGGLILAGAYLKGEPAMVFFLALGMAASFLWYMAAAPKAREGALANIGVTMLGIVYVPFMAGFILVILSFTRAGKALTLSVLGLTFLYDAAAFVIGSFWGSRPLAPTISPKKSWEGLFGATVITFAVAVAVLPSIEPLTLGRAVGLALVVVLFAPLGDLAESAIKRDLGEKDMGSVLPGHGGVLDRIDSVLLVAPAAFYFLRLIF